MDSSSQQAQQGITNSLNKTIDIINKVYDNLNYYDLYGNSILIFIILTIIVFLIVSYCYVMQYKETIADDWINQRCNPKVIPFAGFINKPEDKTIINYTGENFNYCVQNILVGIMGTMTQPFSYLISYLVVIFKSLGNSINIIRQVIHNIRENIRIFVENILHRILNMLIPFQQMIIALKDSLLKSQGALVAGLYTTLGSYYTLKSLMGAILELIIKVLVILVAIIVGLWATIFTWPAAASMSAIFLSISIPLAIIAIFMSQVLKIKSSKIPKLRCFDKNTLIKLKDGTNKIISEIKCGTILENNTIVNAIIKVDAKELKMYNLNNIIVSESHIVLYKDKYIYVEKHPDAILIENYNEPFLYCLNTNKKSILLDNIIFSDWDEIYNSSLNSIINYLTIKFNKKVSKEDIDNLVFEGFNENDKVLTINGLKEIKNIEIGTLLNENNIVYGIVQNINNYDNKLYYHLLVSDKKFIINNILVNDFNYRIDGILEKLKK